MKNKEELNALRNEVEALNKKFSELAKEELEQVTGGVVLKDEKAGEWTPLDNPLKKTDTSPYDCPHCPKFCFDNEQVELLGQLVPSYRCPNCHRIYAKTNEGQWYVKE